MIGAMDWKEARAQIPPGSRVPIVYAQVLLGHFAGSLVQLQRLR